MLANRLIGLPRLGRKKAIAGICCHELRKRGLSRKQTKIFHTPQIQNNASVFLIGAKENYAS
jgi:hypothetical protein